MGRDAWIRTQPDFPEELDPSWRERAVCRTMDKDVFFPPGDDVAEQHPDRINRRYAAPRRICWGRCPVRIECLDYAMNLERHRSTKDRYGMFGGYAPPERARLARGTAVILPEIAEAS